jgi:hypothetical protein
MIFHNIFSFQAMSSSIEFTSPMMYSFFDKCLLNNALKGWQPVMPHVDQRVENFESSLAEWFMA